MKTIDDAGGMYKAVEAGLVQRMIGASAMRFQRSVEAGEQVVVGVNKYQADDDAANRPPVERPDAAAMQRHLDEFRPRKAARSRAAVDEGARRPHARRREQRRQRLRRRRRRRPRRPDERGDLQPPAPRPRLRPAAGHRLTRGRVRRRGARSPSARSPATGARSRACSTLIDDDGARRARRRRAHGRSAPAAPGSSASPAFPAAASRRSSMPCSAPGSRRATRSPSIAIDPSSPISGGAVLGDRIRMGANAAHANVFIRSFSARGELGGLSRAARAAVDALRCLRLRPRHRRDGRHRPVGDAHRRARRHARRRLPARPRRRRPGDQGRHARDRRRPRRQQGRPAARRADRARDARDADAAPARARRRLGAARRRRQRAAATGIDELLEALDAHRDAVGVGRRSAPSRRAPAPSTPAGRPHADGRRRSTPTAGATASPAWSRATASARRSASPSAPAARAAPKWR